MATFRHPLLLLLLLLPSSNGAIRPGHTEVVFIQDLTRTHTSRHLGAPAPLTLRFQLWRQSGTGATDLDLEENPRVSVNVPLYEVKDDGDTFRILQRKPAPKLGTKFYRSKANNGVFRVECRRDKQQKCRRVLHGSITISGRVYNIKPYHRATSTRDFHPHQSQGAPHLLYLPHKYQLTPHNKAPKHQRTPYSKVTKFLKDERKKHLTNFHQDRSTEYYYPANLTKLPPDKGTVFTDYVLRPDYPFSNVETRENLNIEMELERQLKVVIQRKNETPKVNETTRSPVFEVEVLAVIDSELWRRFYRHAYLIKNKRLSTEATAEIILRKRVAHIINGVSAQYEGIDDPVLSIYITLSGIILCKKEKDGPLVNVKEFQGRAYVHGDSYLNSLTDWVAQVIGPLRGDHIMLFTGYDLHHNPIANNVSVGVTYLQGTCSAWRVSIIEDSDYSSTISVATHELGHSLGSEHDGERSSKACSAKSEYIMQPYTWSFRPGDRYHSNPWKFSSCSVHAMKTYMHGLGKKNCLLDLYSRKEDGQGYESQLPGEHYSPDQQCQFISGPNAKLCSDGTSESICLLMQCGAGNTCPKRYFVAADGTPCGQPSQGKWCIFGRCVPYSDKRKTALPKSTQTAPLAKTPPAHAQSQPDCEDEGFLSFSCQELQEAYTHVLHFCSDWRTECCSTCASGNNFKHTSNADRVFTPTHPATAKQHEDVTPIYSGDVTFMFNTVTWTNQNRVTSLELALPNTGYSTVYNRHPTKYCFVFGILSFCERPHLVIFCLLLLHVIK